ncbi:hypothetical protein CONPUDRAFT_79507, partial [Coniophora puteana RWD-64-598 SS2]
MDALYARMEEISRVLMLLPRDCWTVDGNTNEITLTRQLTMNDWSFFRRNSRRVRMFGHPRNPTFLVSSSTLDAICLLPLPPILPHLRVLKWTNEHFHGPFIRQLVGPELTTVSWNCIPFQFFPLISLLGETCQSLQFLSLAGIDGEEDIGISQALENALPAMSSLRSLSLYTTSYRLLEISASLPALEELSFTPPDSDSRQSAPSKEFAIRKLYSESGSLGSFRNALRAMGHLSRLQTIKALSPSPRVDELTEFLAELCLYTNPDQLNALSVMDESCWNDGDLQEPQSSSI